MRGKLDPGAPPPSHAQVLYVTDALSTLALLYTAIFTPFEASFLAPTIGAASWIDGWFLINRVLDVIFLVDMGFQFFIAYEMRDPRGGRTWVFDQRSVIRHYVTRWFPLDAFTLFVPAGFDFSLAGMEENNGSEGTAAEFAGNMSILRVLRCLRLVKLVRLIRASRVYERWKTKISLSHAQMTWVQIFVAIILSAHWGACIMSLQASLHNSPQDTWIGENLYGLCGDDDSTQREDNSTSMAAILSSRMAAILSSRTSVTGCADLSVFNWYVGAFSWSMLVITGTGGTDFYPSRLSIGETALVTFLVLIGALLWTQVLAMFVCDLRGGCRTHASLATSPQANPTASLCVSDSLSDSSPRLLATPCLALLLASHPA